MSDSDFPDGPEQSALTREVVLRYHQSWKQRDLEAVLALYHPDVEYHDFFLNRCLRLADLRDYVRSSMPRQPDEALEHCDRIRVDGHSAFIQYRISLHAGEGLTSFRASEAITVRDGLIWRIHEYASLLRGESTAAASRAPALGKLGLSARQLGFMARDLQDYFQQHQPFLDPELSLQQVADATGYSRNQMSYLLNQVLGQSFYRYLNQARLQYLLAGLEQGHDPRRDDARRIDELAFAAGFNSLSAFYSCFRRHTGLSPKAYLKQRSARTRTHDSD
ncbi:helix-turn-helix transcriptional regulator [Pseudomonas zhanjiangensis]|uniref:Helix-turn-helix domain-containing protein n=1 Tax=Pseudomonas zhanjiangensis TaxID=3239015 RepID=A0ABV3YSG8_9PSED